MFSGQIRRSCGETRPAVDVHRFREVLMLGTLDHYLLANVAQRVCDRARRYVATKHMAHVFPGRSVSCYVSKVPESNTHLRIECLSRTRVVRSNCVRFTLFYEIIYIVVYPTFRW